MLKEGRIPHNDAEGEAIAKLLAKHGDAATLTRRDPGETGPLLVHIGHDSWQIDQDGNATKLKKARR